MKEEHSLERKGCCSGRGWTICLCIWLVFSLLCIGLVPFFIIGGYLGFGSSHYVCTKMQCIKSSAEIDEFVDKDVDPCTDFHGFVCGSFEKTAYEKQLKHPLKFEHDRLENKINSFIVEPIGDRDVQAVVMQKRYFQSCLDEETIDENNNAVFFNFFNKTYGWPLLNDEKWSTAKEISFDWTDVMVRAMQLGLPFDWFLDVDIFDSGYQYLLKLSRPKSCNNFNSAPPQEKILLMGSIIAGFRSHNISVMEQVYQIIRFEEKLADICKSVANDTLAVKSVFEFGKIWYAPDKSLDFVKALTRYTKKWHSYSKLALHQSYIIKLQHLIRNTTKETLANYIGWKTIEHFAPYLSKPIRGKYMEYLNTISDEDVDRFQFCLEDAKSRFNLVSETIYIREYTNSDIKEAGENMVQSIKEALIEMTKNIEWMKNETKDIYMEFYEDLETIVGAPDEIFDNDVFNKYLHIGQLRFKSYNIIQMITEWSQSIHYSKINMIGQRSSSSMLNFAYLANRGFGIFLDTDLNAIFLPATLFHGVIFDIDRPQYLNYASLGSLIGKKLVEGLQNAINDTSDVNEENKECLSRSVNTVNRYLDASFIVDSNYADLVGRHLAYEAYQKYVEDNGEESSLIGLPFSPNELFWIKSSINWCYQDLPNEEPNPPFQDMLKFRIIETVKNSPYFGGDFQCAENSKMNPKDKCEVF